LQKRGEPAQKERKGKEDVGESKGRRYRCAFEEAKEARRADFFPAEEVSREQVRWQRGEEELGEVDELRLALHRDPEIETTDQGENLFDVGLTFFLPLSPTMSSARLAECQPLVPPNGDDVPVPLSAFTRVAPAPRQRRDSAWGVALLASVAFVVASGVFAIRHR
jgi:hypothetical protein